MFDGRLKFSYLYLSPMLRKSDWTKGQICARAKSVVKKGALSCRGGWFENLVNIQLTCKDKEISLNKFKI